MTHVNTQLCSCGTLNKDSVNNLGHTLDSRDLSPLLKPDTQSTTNNTLYLHTDHTLGLPYSTHSVSLSLWPEPQLVNGLSLLVGWISTTRKGTCGLPTWLTLRFPPSPNWFDFISSSQPPRVAGPREDFLL